MRLENYEQWCAVDTVTQGCAGSPAACRAAVVAVLGKYILKYFSAIAAGIKLA